MTEEEKKKGLEDAMCYVNEIEELLDISIEMIDETEDLMNRVSTSHAIWSPIGKERICRSIGSKLDPYSGETMLGVNRDVIEDIKFFVRGLNFILEEKYAYGL